MRKTALIALIVAAPLAAMANPSIAQAGSGPSYNYIGGGFIPKQASSVDGFGIDGSIAVHENFHVAADFVRAKDSPVTLRRARVTGGYRMPLNSRTDFVTRLGWVFAQGSVSGLGSNTRDGALGRIGVRSMMSQSLELNTFLTYNDIRAKTSIDIGGVYHIMPRFGVTAGYSYSSGLQIANVGFRFQF